MANKGHGKDLSETFVEKYGGKALSSLVSGGGGAGIFFGFRDSGDGQTTNAQILLEGLDKALTTDLFLSIGGIAFAIVALLIPKLYELSDEIQRNDKNFPLHAPIRKEFKKLLRALRRLLACFMFCLLGVASSFAFDGPLEYLPSIYQEQSTPQVIADLAGSEWFDIAEASTSVTLLLASLCLFGLGAKTLVTAINEAYKDII